MLQLISDIENIIVEYLDIDDYSKIIKYNPKLYSWEKYFKGNLPSIVDMIHIYSNSDLVEYILQKNPEMKRLDYC